MPIWKIVIGANYGDEGKGLLVDYFADLYKKSYQHSAKQSNVLNVRFNGGAQAGHTVVTPERQRHVFSHIGAATFTGSRTYLAKPFIVNPLVYCLERKILHTKFSNIPKIFVNGACSVTTPFDVGINQVVESQRGNNRHGSCGLGIGETVERHTTSHNFELTVDDLGNHNRLRDKLQYIKEFWVPYRAHELGIDKNHILSIAGENLSVWLSFADEFLHYSVVCGDEVLRESDHVIFEGAQGLALDQKYFSPSNPHVTRSNCGITNVVEIAQNEKIEILDVTYVSRCYMTRHGRGELPNEVPMPAWVQDQTNISNVWQGSLRYAPNTFKETFDRIKDDLKPFENLQLTINFDLAVTCVDQMPQYELSKSQAKNVVELASRYNSFGPTRDNVREQPYCLTL